jgi:outer membrane phospholipase A
LFRPTPFILALFAAGCARPAALPRDSGPFDLSALVAASEPAPPSTAPAPASTEPAAVAPPSSQEAGGEPEDEPPLVPRESFLSGYRPTYVLIGPTDPNVKFQFSVKLRLFSPDGAAGRAFPPLSMLYLAYTQMSLWDIENPSKSTVDTTFMPEFFFATHTPPLALEEVHTAALGLQAGVQHESNGRPGEASRNINYFYAQPTLYLGDPKSVSGQFGVRARTYFSGLNDNPDIAEFYGNVGFSAAVRFAGNLQLAAEVRPSDDWERGAVQVDLTYPLKRYVGGPVDTFLHVQYFNGFAESILTYRDHHQTLRVGVSFIR